MNLKSHLNQVIFKDNSKLLLIKLILFVKFKNKVIYYLNETIEPKKFVKFYNQIPNESIKHSFLDAFFLNSKFH